MSKMGIIARSGIGRKPNETMRLIVMTFLGVVFGFLIGISFSTISLASSNSINDLVLFGQLKFPSIDMGYGDDSDSDFSIQAQLQNAWASIIGHNTTRTTTTDSQILNDTSKIWVPTNPRGAEMLPPGIVASESDFYLRRLWGKPSEDLTIRPKYLVTFTVGYSMKQNVDEAVKKFSDNFTIMLFHYDGLTTEWDEFEWSKRAIHVSVKKQTKWWYVKRFLHPDIVAAYDYIFIWDEDLGVENFNAEEYIRLVRKHKLEISQPGLEPNRKLVWQMTKRRDGLEVHKQTEEKPGWCRNPHLPPCAAFVEIMAPVFSRDAWRCVWNMIQNDLVHGWGLDFAMRRCVEPGHERIGVVDAQWIVHQSVPSLGSQGESENGEAPWKGVRDRCKKEWWMFRVRMENAEKKYYRDLEIMENAEKKYYRDLEINPPNSTAH